MSDLLTKLQEREAKLKAQIKTAKAAQAKKEAANDNRRAAIAWPAVMAAMKEKPELAALVNDALHTNVTNPKERKLLGLQVLPKEEKN